MLQIFLLWLIVWFGGTVNQNEKLHKRTTFHQKKISSVIIIIQLSYSITLLSGVQDSI